MISVSLSFFSFEETNYTHYSLEVGPLKSHFANRCYNAFTCTSLLFLPDKKMCKDLSRLLPRQATANTCSPGSCSASLLSRQIHIKTTKRFHLSRPVLSKPKQHQVTSAGHTRHIPHGNEYGGSSENEKQNYDMT